MNNVYIEKKKIITARKVDKKNSNCFRKIIKNKHHCRGLYFTSTEK